MRLTELPVPLDLPPMEAKLVDEIPREAGWRYEPKWDGFRCLLFVGDAIDSGLARRSRRSHREPYLPFLVGAGIAYWQPHFPLLVYWLVIATGLGVAISTVAALAGLAAGTAGGDRREQDAGDRHARRVLDLSPWSGDPRDAAGAAGSRAPRCRTWRRAARQIRQSGQR